MKAFIACVLLLAFAVNTSAFYADGVIQEVKSHDDIDITATHVIPYAIVTDSTLIPQ